MVKSVSRLPPPSGINLWSQLPGEHAGSVPFHLEILESEIQVPPSIFRVYDQDVEVSPTYKTTYMAQFNAVHSYVQGKRLRVRPCRKCVAEKESGCNECTSFEVEAVMFRQTRMNGESPRMRVPVRAPFSLKKDATSSMVEFLIYSRLEAQIIILEDKEKERAFYRKFGESEEYKVNGLVQLAYELAAAYDSKPPGHFEYLGRTAVATLALFKAPAAAGKTYALLENLSDGDAIICPTATLAGDITKRAHSAKKSIAVMTYQKAVTAFLMGYRFRRVGLDEAFLFHQGAHVMAQCMALECAVLTGDEDQIEAVQRLQKKDKPWKWNVRTANYTKAVEMRRNYRSKPMIVKVAGAISGKPQRCMRTSTSDQGIIDFVRLPAAPTDMRGLRSFIPPGTTQAVTILQETKSKLASDTFQTVASAHEFQGSESDAVWFIVDSTTLGRQIGKITSYIYVGMTRARDVLHISAPEWLREIIVKAMKDEPDYTGPELVDITHLYPDLASADFEGPGVFQPPRDSMMQSSSQGALSTDVKKATVAIMNRRTGHGGIDALLARGVKLMSASQDGSSPARRGTCIICEETHVALDFLVDACTICADVLLRSDQSGLDDYAALLNSSRAPSVCTSEGDAADGNDEEADPAPFCRIKVDHELLERCSACDWDNSIVPTPFVPRLKYNKAVHKKLGVVFRFVLLHRSCVKELLKLYRRHRRATPSALSSVPGPSTSVHLAQTETNPTPPGEEEGDIYNDIPFATEEDQVNSLDETQRIPAWSTIQQTHPLITKATYNKISRLQKRAQGFRTRVAVVHFSAEEKAAKGWCYLEMLYVRDRKAARDALGQRPLVGALREFIAEKPFHSHRKCVWGENDSVWHVAPEGDEGTPFSALLDSDRLGSDREWPTMAPIQYRRPGLWIDTFSLSNLRDAQSPGAVLSVMFENGLSVEAVEWFLQSFEANRNFEVTMPRQGVLRIRAVSTSDTWQQRGGLNHGNIRVMVNRIQFLRLKSEHQAATNATLWRQENAEVRRLAGLVCKNPSEHTELEEIRAFTEETDDEPRRELLRSLGMPSILARLTWQRDQKRKARAEFNACHTALGLEKPYPSFAHQVDFVGCSHGAHVSHCTVFNPGTEILSPCMEHLAPQLEDHDDWHTSADDCLTVGHFTHEDVANDERFPSCKTLCHHTHDDLRYREVTVEDPSSGEGATITSRVDQCHEKFADQICSHDVLSDLVPVHGGGFYTIVQGRFRVPDDLAPGPYVDTSGSSTPVLSFSDCVRFIRSALVTVSGSDFQSWARSNSPLSRYRCEFIAASTEEGEVIPIDVGEGQTEEVKSEWIDPAKRARVVLQLVEEPMPYPADRNPNMMIPLVHADLLLDHNRLTSFNERSYKNQLEAARKDHFGSAGLGTCARRVGADVFTLPDGTVVSGHDMLVKQEHMVPGKPRASCRRMCMHSHADFCEDPSDCAARLSALGDERIRSICGHRHESFSGIACMIDAIDFARGFLKFTPAGYSVDEDAFKPTLFAPAKYNRDEFMTALRLMTRAASTLLSDMGLMKGAPTFKAAFDIVASSSETPSLVKWAIQNPVGDSFTAETAADSLLPVLLEMDPVVATSFFRTHCQEHDDEMPEEIQSWSVFRRMKQAYVAAPRASKLQAATDVWIERAREVGTRTGESIEGVLQLWCGHTSTPVQCPNLLVGKYRREECAEPGCVRCHDVKSVYGEVDKWAGPAGRQEVLKSVTHGKLSWEHSDFCTPELCRAFLDKLGADNHMVSLTSVGFDTISLAIGHAGWRPSPSFEGDFVRLVQTLFDLGMMDVDTLKAVGPILDPTSSLLCQDATAHGHVCAPCPLPHNPVCAVPHGPICPDPSVDHGHVCRPIISCGLPHGPICPRPSIDHAHSCKPVVPCGLVHLSIGETKCTHKATDLVENHKCRECKLPHESHKPEDLLVNHKCKDCTLPHESHKPEDLLANHACPAIPGASNHRQRACLHTEHVDKACKIDDFSCITKSHLRSRFKNGKCSGCGVSETDIPAPSGCRLAEVQASDRVKISYEKGRAEAARAFEKAHPKIRAAYVRPTFSKPNMFEFGSGGKMRLGNQTFHVAKSLHLTVQLARDGKVVKTKDHRFEGLWSDWVVTPRGMKRFYDGQSEQHKMEMIKNARMTKKEFEELYLKDVDETQPDVVRFKDL